MHGLSFGAHPVFLIARATQPVWYRVSIEALVSEDSGDLHHKQAELQLSSSVPKPVLRYETTSW